MEEDWENWCHRPGSLIHVFIPVLRREFSFLQEKLALQVTLRHSGREQRGDALAVPGRSLGMQQAEINPNDPVFPGDVSQSESAPMRPPFPLSAA